MLKFPLHITFFKVLVLKEKSIKENKTFQMWRQFSPVGGTCLPQQRVSCSWVTQVCLFRRVAGGHCLTFWLRSDIHAMVLGCFPWISFMLKCHFLYFKETSLSGKSVHSVRVLVTCSVVFNYTSGNWSLVARGPGGFGSTYVCVVTAVRTTQQLSPPHSPRTLMLPFLRSC